jgi:N-acetylmuramoyl-L-alanine amidase
MVNVVSRERLFEPFSFKALMLTGAVVALLGGDLSEAHPPIDSQDQKKLVPALQPSSTPLCDPSYFKIVVDVGHTVQAPGATSARGVTEYAFNLALAKRISESLKDAGYRNTYLLTTVGKGRQQLEERSARANSLGANLFLSIHHDDVQPVYYSTWQYSGRTYKFSDRFSGYSILVSYQNRHFKESLLFARLLGGALQTFGMHFNRSHSEKIKGENREILDYERGVYRYDQLLVLKNTFAPAVLLEAGVIVNRDEENALVSPERQNAIGAAVTASTKQFCSDLNARPQSNERQ